MRRWAHGGPGGTALAPFMATQTIQNGRTTMRGIGIGTIIVIIILVIIIF